MVKQLDFPDLSPPAIDFPHLEPPVMVHSDDVASIEEFPDGRGKTKYLLTESTARCRYINMGLFFAEPGQGSQWHTHPQDTGEEEYLYILKGSGTMFYKHAGKDQKIEFKEGAAIFTGHLTHYIKNTGSEELYILFSIAPLPQTTIIYGVKNDEGLEYVDSVNLKPPQVVNADNVATHSFGTIIARHLLYPETVGAQHGRLGTALEKPGMGSQWHTHPLEVGEEDLFYIAKGEGTYVYLQGGKVHTFKFKEGDAVHSHHLTNYTLNTGSEDAFIPFVGAPSPARTILHDGDLLTL
jgi:oxalate decarboxylase/phosphoglucose isomerase-like protein (cupin superfamily)